MILYLHLPPPALLPSSRNLIDLKIMADPPCCYPKSVDDIREEEYPSLKGKLTPFSEIVPPPLSLIWTRIM